MFPGRCRLAGVVASPVSVFISRRPPTSRLFPYTTLFRSNPRQVVTRELALERVWGGAAAASPNVVDRYRSEEHTSELQSHSDLVCRLLLEKKNHPCRAPASTNC